jgi:hypothetical protein
MDKPRETPRSHLFVLRLWCAHLGDNRTEWRGEVRSVTSCERRYFRDWSVLLEFVQACCQQNSPPAGREDDFLEK